RDLPGAPRRRQAREGVSDWPGGRPWVRAGDQWGHGRRAVLGVGRGRGGGRAGGPGAGGQSRRAHVGAVPGGCAAEARPRHDSGAGGGGGEGCGCRLAWDTPTTYLELVSLSTPRGCCTSL